jgi:predicted nucleic acid-binding protein
LIHLYLGGVLDVILALDDYAFFIGSLARGEVVQLRDVLDQHIDAGRIVALPEDELSFDEVADFAEQTNLGVGESECIVFCGRRPDLNLCSNDKKARAVATDNLTRERVLGIADLLKVAIQQGLLTPQDAFAAYELMRARGAFLPQLPREDFII